MRIRPAVLNDCDLLHDWVNDEVVRKTSFNSKRIDYADHQKWFMESLRKKERIILIAENDSFPIGQVRFDKDDHRYFVDFSVSPNCRGKGLGTIMLYEAMLYLSKILSEIEFVGRVKKDNISSQKVFEKLSFIKSEKGEYFEYTLDSNGFAKLRLDV